MTLNVRLEEAPDAILEAVMARILRNRQKMQDNQQQIQRPLLQPKPQVRNQGADNRTWKKPEPAATAQQAGDGAWLLIPSNADFNAKVRNIPPFALKQLSYDETDDNSIILGTGPAGAFSLVAPFPTAPQVSIDCPAEEGDQIANITREPASKSCTIEFMFSLPSLPYDSRGPYSSIDFGCGPIGYISVGQYWTLNDDIPQAALDRYASIDFAYGSYTECFLSNDVNGFIASSSLPTTTERLPDLNSTEWRHAAIVQTPGSTANARNASFYFHGRRVAHLANITDESALPLWGDPFDPFPINIYFQATYGTSNGTPLSNQSCAGHGFRYTPRALYTGDTYTPPTSITRLA
jgi:hypothetical protein